MTSQSQPGPKPFVFGETRSTSTSSSPEKPQSFFDCVEEQSQKHGTPASKRVAPVPAYVTVETRDGEVEERPPSSGTARKFKDPFAATVDRFEATVDGFDRIGNVWEPFNIIGTSTESGTTPSSLFEKSHPSDSQATPKPFERCEYAGGLFGQSSAPGPSTSIFSKPTQAGSGSASSSLFGNYPHHPGFQDPLSDSASVSSHEHNGVGLKQPSTRGPPVQPGKVPPSIFESFPPPQEKSSSSLFGDTAPPSTGNTSSGLFGGTSLFDNARPLEHTPYSLFGDPPPAQPTTFSSLPPPQSENSSSSLLGNTAPSSTDNTSSGLFGGTSLSGNARPLGSEHTPYSLFGNPPPAQSTIFSSLPPPQSENSSSSLFGNTAPSSTGNTSSGLFGGTSLSGNARPLGSEHTPYSLFGDPRPAQSTIFSSLPPPPSVNTSSSLPANSPSNPVSSQGLFARWNDRYAPSSANANASSNIFGFERPITSGIAGVLSNQQPDIFSTDAKSNFQDRLIASGVYKPRFDVRSPQEDSAASDIRSSRANAACQSSDQDLQPKTDDAWTQQESKIQLARSLLRDAETHGQQTHKLIGQEREQHHEWVKNLEKTLEEKQAQIKAMQSLLREANEKSVHMQSTAQVNESKMSASNTSPSEDEWLIHGTANRKFRYMHTKLHEIFSGGLFGTNLEDIWYDLYNVSLERDVLLRKGTLYFRRSEEVSVPPEIGGILAAPPGEKKQTQITDTFQETTQVEASSGNNRGQSDTSNAVSQPAASESHASVFNPGRNLTGKIIKGRHGRMMSLGRSEPTSEEPKGQGQLTEALRIESTKALEVLTPTSEAKPATTRSRSDTTPLPVRTKRSSSTRPFNKDEADPTKQASASATRPLIKDEWLTNEQRISRVRKEEDETVEKAMLRKRQQKA